jgi:hypothetical protein
VARRKGEGLDRHRDDGEAQKEDAFGTRSSSSLKNTTPQQAQSWRNQLKIHPAAELFGLLDAKALIELPDDIKANGLKLRAAVKKEEDGSWVLLDGRNRLDAVEASGGGGVFDETMFEQLPADTDTYAYVLSVNILRRHLTAEQRRDLLAQLIKANTGKTVREIAKMASVSPATAGRAIARVWHAIARVSRETRPATRVDSIGRRQPTTKRRTAERKIAPERQALAEQMHRDFQLAKVEDYAPGNVSAEEKRDTRNKILAIGTRALAKQAHPDAGGSHEEMSRGDHADAQQLAQDKLIGPTIKTIIAGSDRVYEMRPDSVAMQKAAVAAGLTSDTGWALPLSD